MQDMQMKTNKVARQLSSMPVTHRQSTLSAISAKTHSLTAQITHLGVESARLKDLVDGAPGNGVSRLDWIHQQINKPN